ncbi:RNA ligase family protein [Acinetobacter sp.]|uniref:RNA ligase family protein n=1 Tax=Acinetobacter sp. TaxID=472 RepID=UPI00388D885F
MGQTTNLQDMYEGIEQAQKMNENLTKHDTIDTPAEVAQDLKAQAAKMKREQLIAEAMADGRKLVTVRKIDAIGDIPGADLIKVATVEGWKVVVKAGEFKSGDLCVFFEVDSYLPLDDERYAFLDKNAVNWEGIRGARLKTIRLRKQLSQGLALPLEVFPEIIDHLIGLGIGKSEVEKIREINFTGVLGIMKWDKPINAQLAGMAKGNFPSFLRKSDQERCQNMGNQIFGYEPTYSAFDTAGIPPEALLAMSDRGEARYRTIDLNSGQWERVRPAQASRDTRYEVTLKMDGSSMTVYRHGEGDEVQEGVCSRNLDLKMEGNDENAFVQMANEGVLQAMRDIDANDIALQGELMGPSVQGNQERFSLMRFFVYNVFDIKKGEFMNPYDRQQFMKLMNDMAISLGNLPVEHVPVLHMNVTLGELGITDMQSLLKFADGPSMNSSVREGLVFKAVNGEHQFKAISNKWLEAEK